MKGFNVRKAAQVVAFFTKSEGGQINVLKAVKLVYLADRKFMEKYDCPILHDRFVSMDHGPVDSVTLDFINGFADDPGRAWSSFVTDRSNHQIGLANPEISIEDLDELSEAEIEVLQEISDQFKTCSGYQVRDYTHTYCPEWEDPDGSSKPIPYEKVFRALGKENARDLEADVEAERNLNSSILSAD